MPDDLKIRLPKDLSDRVDKELIDSIHRTVIASTARDVELRAQRDMIDGIPDDVHKGPWENSCNVDDSLFEEQLRRQVAFTVASYSNDTPVIVSAISPEDASAATQIESAMKSKSLDWGYGEFVGAVAHHGWAYDFCPAIVGWKRRTARTREMGLRDPATGLAFQEVQAKELGLIETGSPSPIVVDSTAYDGLDAHVFDPWDLYLHPAGSQSIDLCTRVIQRIHKTEDGLLEAIGDDGEGFDEESVYQLLSGGPTTTSELGDEFTRIQKQEGYEPNVGRDGFYRCYQVVGRLPLLLDSGKPSLPKEFRGEDWLSVICPERQVVLKRVPWKYPLRPYVIFHTWSRPGRLHGKGLAKLLDGPQTEATTSLRINIDSATYAAYPMRLEPNSAQDEDRTMRLGGVWRWDRSAGKPEFLQIPTAGQMLLSGLRGEVRSHAEQLVSAENVMGQLGRGSKQRRSAEVQFTASQVSLKDRNSLAALDVGMTRFWKLAIMFWQSALQSGASPDATGITPGHLSKPIRVTPHSNPEGADQTARLELIRAKTATMMQYFQAIATLPPDQWPMCYHAARTALQAMQERSPESFLGREPQAGDPAMILSVMFQKVSQLAQQGDPTAGALLQEASQLMQQGPQWGQGQQQGQAQPQGMLPAAPEGAKEDNPWNSPDQ